MKIKVSRKGLVGFGLLMQVGTDIVSKSVVVCSDTNQDPLIINFAGNNRDIDALKAKGYDVEKLDS